MGDELTRYLKPVKKVVFSDFEVLQAMIKADVDPEEIASVCQIKGSKSQIIRVTMKTHSSACSLDELMKKRRLSVKGVVLGEVVGTSGSFVEVTLENVPQFISDSDVEEEMGRYGRVVSSEKSYIDIMGHRIANEKRVVLFSSLHDTSSLKDCTVGIGSFRVHASIHNLSHSPCLRKHTTAKPSPERRKSYHGREVKEEDEEGWGSLLAGVNRSVNCRQCVGGSSGGGLCGACGRGMARRGTLTGVEGREGGGMGGKSAPKDELLEFLRGNRRPSRDNISAVAYRQSMVVRDDGGVKHNLNDDVVVSGREVLSMLEKMKKDEKKQLSSENKNFNPHRRVVSKKEEKEEEKEKGNSLGWLKRFGSIKLGLKREEKVVKGRKDKVHEPIKTSTNTSNEAPVIRKSCLKKTSTDYGRQNSSFEQSPKVLTTRFRNDSIPKTTALTSTSPIAVPETFTASDSALNVFENLKKLVKSPQKTNKKLHEGSPGNSNTPPVIAPKPAIKSTPMSMYNKQNDKVAILSETFKENSNNFSNKLNKTTSTTHKPPYKSNPALKTVPRTDDYDESNRLRRKQKRNEAFQELSAYLMY